MQPDPNKGLTPLQTGYNTALTTKTKTKTKTKTNTKTKINTRTTHIVGQSPLSP